MKKILLIMAGDFHFKGGIENYNLLLFDILFTYYKNFQVDIVLPSCKYIPEKLKYPCLNFIYYKFAKNHNWKSYFLNGFVNFIDDLNNVNRAKLFIKKIKDKYDLILNSSLICFHSCKNNLNYYLIQHVNLEAYLFKLNEKKYSYKITTWIGKFLYGSFNFLKYSRNIIVYDQLVKDKILNYSPNTNVIDISLPSKMIPISVEELMKTKKERIIFLGRIDYIKNIPALIDINKKLNLIDFYGGAESKIGLEYKDILEKNHWYKGVIKDQQKLQNIFLKYKFLILYSFSEGFSFSLVEALSQGLPIIVKDTFLSALFLCNKKTGLLLPKDTSVDEDILLIKKFISMSDEQYHQYQMNCINFYNENLSIDIFTQKWKKIFNRYLDKKE